MTMELKCCPFCGGEAESDSRRGYRNISTGNPEKAAAIYCTKCSADMTWCYRDTPEIERDQVMTLLIEQWNTRATASLEGDAVERVARLWQDLLDKDDRTSPEEYPDMALISFEEFEHAILATGLVPNEAAVRADWHTTGWDRARNSGRILLVWREAHQRTPIDLLADSDDETKRCLAAAITAYLAQMEKEGFVMVPKEATGEAKSAISAFVRSRAIPSPSDSDPDDVYFDAGHARELYAVVLAAAQNGGDLPAPPMGK